MSVLIDLVGKQFGNLTVMERGPNDINGCPRWWCKCSCGNKDLQLIHGVSLREGRTTSCGCIHKERTRQANQGTNTFDLSNEYAIGYTQIGKAFLFDKEDYEKIKDYYWWLNANGYVCANDNYSGVRKVIYLHKFVMGLFDTSSFIDHINRNKFDNRKENLRFCTNSQNIMNCPIKSNNTSGVIGVCWDKKKENWLAYISVNKKHKFLGNFSDKNDAIVARLQAEAKYYQEFAPQQSLFEKYNIKLINEEE